MNPMPTRDTPAGRAYNDLRNLAKRQGRDVSEYFILYALEGFLIRLSASPFADQLVLKGGVLMAAFSARRPTRDIDLNASGFPNEISETEQRIKRIVGISIDDGLEFDLASIQAEAIRDDGDYKGVRVHLTVLLSKARIPCHVDINFGDPIWPEPTATKLPKLLGGELELLGYPISMVLAEKIVTAIERSSANTRWRDFVDIATIAATQYVAGDELSQSIQTVANYREVKLTPLAAALEDMSQIVQPKWVAWRRKMRIEAATPESFQILLSSCVTFVDPVLAGDVAGMSWSPIMQIWE